MRDGDGPGNPATSKRGARRWKAFGAGVAALFIVGLLASGAFGDVSSLTVTGRSASSDSSAATDTTAASSDATASATSADSTSTAGTSSDSVTYTPTITSDQADYA